MGEMVMAGAGKASELARMLRATVRSVGVTGGYQVSSPDQVWQVTVDISGGAAEIETTDAAVLLRGQFTAPGCIVALLHAAGLVDCPADDTVRRTVSAVELFDTAQRSRRQVA